MSDELISRSALKKDLEVTPYNDIDDLVRTERLIDNASAVDAYPFEQVQELVKLNQQFAQEIENLKRPKGKWIESKEHFYTNESCKEWTNFYCSECDVPSISPSNFCPNCGARMER